jgi:hypothetical protein
MKQSLVALGAACLLAALIQACAPSVQFTPTAGARKQKPNDARVLIFSPNDSLPKGAENLGFLSVGDAGMTVSCDLPVILQSATEAARAVGADAIKVVSISRPDMMSTCWGVKAFAVALDHADTAGLNAADFTLNEEFLEFSDVPVAGDYGDESDVKSDKPPVVRLPFLCLTRSVTSLDRSNYMWTGKAIDDYFKAALEPRYSCVDARTLDSNAANAVGRFAQALAESAAFSARPPTAWGRPLPAGAVDPKAVLFLPIGIERESAVILRGRFYMILCNASGDVLFCRCIKYDPSKWFATIDDVKSALWGKVALAEFR